MGTRAISTTSRLSTAASTAVAIAGLLLLMLWMPPWQPLFPTTGLDPSWAQVLQFAHDRGWKWGPEVLITFGPLGYVHPRLYDPGTYDIVLPVWCFLAFAMGLGIVAIAGRTGVLPALVAVTGIVLSAVGTADTFFLAMPLLLVLVWGVADGRLRRPALACLVLAVAITTQIKLSALPVCLLSTVLIDGARTFRRRWPISTAAYLLAVLASWKVAGQDFGDLPSYIVQTLDIVGGYDSAVQMFGSKAEVAAYLGCALLAVAVFGYGLIRPGSPLTRESRLIIGVMALGYLQVSFKAGFVRHDLHSLIAWLALCFGASLLLLVPTASSQGRRLRHLAVILPMLPFVGYWFLLYSANGMPFSVTMNALNPSVILARANAARWVLSGDARPEFDRLWREARTRIAAASTIPRVQGTVDILPSHQAELIARGDDYTPRPIFQGYAAYTPRLAESNRQFFEGPRAPRNVLFGLEPIDNRYPAMIDGTIWPALLGRYEPTRLTGDYLVLQRRSMAQEVVAADAQRRIVAVNEKVPLWTSPTARAIRASIRLRETLLGRLVHRVWKPPVVDLVVRDAREQPHQFRLVPGSAEAGFILSPIVLSPDDFLGLYLADIPASDLDRASSLSVVLSWWGLWVYHADVEIELAELRIPVVDNPAFASMSRNFGILRKLASTSPEVVMQDGTVFAHAPNEMSLPVSGSPAATVAFGIKDGAWQGGNQVHGVTFRVLAQLPSGERRELWSRTLQPLTVASDRELQHASIPVPPDAQHLIFQTAPLDGDTRWAWSYWGKIGFDTDKPQP